MIFNNSVSKYYGLAWWAIVAGLSQTRYETSWYEKLGKLKKK